MTAPHRRSFTLGGGGALWLPKNPFPLRFFANEAGKKAERKSWVFMHDNYLFTLGVCGSASASSPALGLLETMLRVLHPVKRAALLGEVVALVEGAFTADPMALPILADIADAELLLIVTPFPANRLPARLTTILAMQAPPNPTIRGRHALLVGICGAQAPAMEPLTTFCQTAGFHLAGTLCLPPALAATPAAHHAVAALARYAYTLAQRHNPAVLPHEVP